MEDRKVECDEAEQHFQRESSVRHEQLETIGLVLDMINSRYGQLRKYLLRR